MRRKQANLWRNRNEHRKKTKKQNESAQRRWRQEKNPEIILTLKKCGRKRPIEYFAMSVVSCCIAVPKAKMPIWRYAFVIQAGIVNPNTCNLVFAGILLILTWMNSTEVICKEEQRRRLVWLHPKMSMIKIFWNVTKNMGPSTGQFSMKMILSLMAQEQAKEIWRAGFQIRLKWCISAYHSTKCHIFSIPFLYLPSRILVHWNRICIPFH